MAVTDLIDNHVKLLAKVLAKRLEVRLSALISDDRTGFTLGHQLSSNIRRLLNMIFTPSSSPMPEMVLSLDRRLLIGWNGIIYLQFYKNLVSAPKEFHGYVYYNSSSAWKQIRNHRPISLVSFHQSGLPTLTPSLCFGYRASLYSLDIDFSMFRYS